MLQASASRFGDSFASFEELETALEESEKKKISSSITVTNGQFKQHVKGSCKAFEVRVEYFEIKYPSNPFTPESRRIGTRLTHRRKMSYPVRRPLDSTH